MSGQSRLVNNKLTSEGKASKVNTTLGKEINKIAAGIKNITCKIFKNYGNKSNN